MSAKLIQFPLLSAIRKHPKNVALRQSRFILSYSELYSKASDLVQAMAAKGVRPGQIVALGDLPPQDKVILLWACWLGKFIAFPLNIRFPSSFISETLKQMDPALVISESSYPNYPTIAPTDLSASVVEMQINLPEYEMNAPATLLMTSGSSGEPKFVQHSFRNHIGSAKASNLNIPLTEDDKWLLNLPLYHIGGLSLLYRTAIAGAELVIPKAKQGVRDPIRAFRVTHISMVSTQLQRLLEDAEGQEILKGLSAILIGGSAIPRGLIQKSLELGLPIHVSYGSTEMSSQITTTGAEERAAALDNSGKPLVGTNLLISHEGEIMVRGDKLAMGYIENSKLVDLRDEAGWFHTGDVGYVNVQGALTVTGRMDNQFISGGENIQPEHIERLLNQISGITNSVVIPRRDDEFGARPVAFLENSDTSLDQESIKSILSTKLPGYMIPTSYYHLTKELVGDDMKISRKKLQNLLDAGNKALSAL